MHRTFALMTVIICYIGLFLIFLSWSHFSAYEGPKARDGVLDLTHWNFEKDGAIELNGTWSFYPNQLLSPEKVQAGAGKNKHLVMIPENAQSVKNQEMYRLSDKGTYHLTIRSQEDHQIFGIQTGTIYGSNKIFMNDIQIGGNGNPANKAAGGGSLKPYVAYFPLHRGNNELVIQVSRSVGMVSMGIAKPIVFDTQQKISFHHDLVLFNDMTMIVAFFIMGLYLFGYFIQRRKDFHLLFFSFICLLFSVIISWLSQGRVIYLIFPQMPYPLLVLLESVTTLSFGAAILLYLYFTYPQFVAKAVAMSGVGLSLLTLLLDFIPWDPLTPVTMVLHTFLAISILTYASYIFVLAIIKKAEGSGYLMVATTSMGVFVMVTTINAYIAKPLFSVYSLPSLLFLLMISLLMSQRFSNAFNRSESLAQELVHSNHVKDEFIARTSHEFRTPLNAIINIAQTLLAGNSKRTIGEEKDKLNLITRIGYRLSDLVNDILDLEKIKQGKLEIKPVPLDVYTTIKVEFAFYKLLADKKGLSLVNRVPHDLPFVLADENRFRQMVNNLVDNAVKYTQKGRITLSAKQAGSYIEFMVADTGPGIPESETKAIFQAFERRDALNQSEGAGLGLSIVKQLAELQGGALWVYSKVGTGSVFHFTVPVFDPAKGIAEGATVQIPDIRLSKRSEVDSGFVLSTPYYSQHGNAPTIMVVDDSLENLKILIDMLEGIPYNVVAVKNGQEALDIVRHVRLDLVILDLMMPGMSGYDVCEEIRRRYSLTELPVLMLTAAIINDDKHYAFRAGANDILQKPYNFSEFSARIRGLILMKNAASQATNMEVAFLQSQIRPHFLYNVLNSINALSYEDIDKSREMTVQFAAYLRGSFDFQNTSAISSFKRELSLVRSYLAIEKMRFEDRIEVVFDIEDQIDFPLPPLMIQPLVENAVQHGIGRQKTGGRVTLFARREENGYVIRVSDNGTGMPPEQIKKLLTSHAGRSVGLKNINSRLKHFYGTELIIQSEQGKGTAIEIHVPEK